MRNRGFTLVELLVIIATISVLAALLLPAAAKTREKARSAQCVDNLRQWALAYRMYADDNADFLPRRGQGVQVLAQIDRPTDWFNALPAYFGLPSFQDMVLDKVTPEAHSASVFICPSAENSGGTYFLPYGMNMNLCPWNLPSPTKYSEVVQPSCVVTLAEAPGPYASTFPSTKAYSVIARHASRVNLLFLEGQVRSLAGSYVGCGVGDAEQSDLRWLTGTASDASVHNY